MFDFSRNYFELFGMPADFVLDAGELAARYRELQKLVHPDRFAASGEHSQRLSLQSATMVNEAYESLKDPLKRAQYLLVLRGVEPDAQQQSLNDPAFLMEQMALREALAEVRNAADPQAELDVLLGQIGRMIKGLVAQLAVQFEDSSPAQLAAAVQTVQKMQFLNKLHAEAEAIDAELEENY
jgi:molecular chaperone HscB